MNMKKHYTLHLATDCHFAHVWATEFKQDDKLGIVEFLEGGELIAFFWQEDIKKVEMHDKDEPVMVYPKSDVLEVTGDSFRTWESI